jgi:hypothetical protein
MTYIEMNKIKEDDHSGWYECILEDENGAFSYLTFFNASNARFLLIFKSTIIFG